MTDTKNIKAEELRVGDFIRISVMGGIEDMMVESKFVNADGTINFIFGNMIAEITDNHVAPEQVMRLVRSNE